MIYEEQTYTLQVGKVPVLMRAYEQRGLAVLHRHLGDLVGCWGVDLGGDIDEMVQVWRFADVEDRRQRRLSLAEDPDWVSFAGEYGHLITRRRMRLLSPASFSPLA
ncbi:NIPSNAP family protein [Geodermatophilus ruber]|uniref:NIPSNAP protein n=1 Tax=Geodermatophilus ruber TaxID=504800 RepID=A0A1I4KLJ4_9ACTN|nr:NIPSNAP family protein [Geodermatophilus ruber]SFL79459.1 NIPSNAP protein [Geodermatophilus ruber]